MKMFTRPHLSLVLVFSLVGCFGELENQPFEPGVTRLAGTLSGPIGRDRAWVAVVGSPHLQSTLDANGHFEILSVPAGEIELAASTGAGAAARHSLHAYNDRVAEIRIQSEPGITILGRVVHVTGHPDATERIRVDGLPVVAAPSSTGDFTLSDLPRGCHFVQVEQTGYLPAQRKICATPGQTVTLADLPLNSSAAAHSGACVPCSTAAECLSGVCIANGGQNVCVERCAAGKSCASGFTCTTSPMGDACLPAEATCAGLLDQHHNQSCHEDSDCGLAGQDDGLCVEGRCSVRCDQGHCSNGACVAVSHGGHVCR